MTQKEKELLLKDLCGRLPYMPKIKITYQQQGIKGTDEGRISCDFIEKIVNDLRNGVITDIQIYLRPMSSMTKEEKEEMHNLLSPEGTAVYENNGINIPMNHCGDFVSYEFMNRIIQYLLKNHFDFMGLIPRGLALEAPEEMYKKGE